MSTDSPPRRRDRLLGALRGRLSSLLRAPSPSLARLSIESGPSGDFAPDTAVLQAALHLGVDLDHFCGGHASCGSCRIELLSEASSLSPMQPRERMVLGEARARQGDRLACQALLRGPATVRVPRYF